MEYIDNIYTRLALKCLGVSPSGDEGYYGYSGPFVVGLTVDTIGITADSDLITADMTTISVDDEI